MYGGIGTFGLVVDGKIQDLESKGTISKSSIIGVGGIVGAIKGTQTNKAQIINCTNSAVISGSDKTGGIAGYCFNVSVKSCQNLETVSGKTVVGGIMGQYTKGGEVLNCSNFKKIKGTSCYVGGIVGWMENISSTMKVSSCYNKGKIEGTTCAGGIVGFMSENISTIDIEICCNIGYVVATATGSDSNSGGIVGWINGGTVKVKNCLNANHVKGKEHAGGITGGVNNWDSNVSLTISNCAGYIDLETANKKGGIIAGVYKNPSKSYTTSVIVNYTYFFNNYSSYGYKESGATLTLNNSSGFADLNLELAENEKFWIKSSGNLSAVYWLNGESNTGQWVVDTRNVSKKIAYGLPYLKDVPPPEEWTFGE